MKPVGAALSQLDQSLPIGPRAEVIYYRLLMYTLKHTAVLHLKCPVLDFYDCFCLGSCWDCCNGKLYYEKKHIHTVSAICLAKRPP